MRVKGKGTRGGRAAGIFFGLMFVACVSFCAYLLVSDFLGEKAYDELAASSASTPSAAFDGDPGIDWAGLLAQNPECVAWLSVDGTAIDYPVVKPGNGKAHDYYLSHGFWGSQDATGCPYLDRRCDADGIHMLVFGHRMGFSGRMFSPIWDAYEQDRFDALGDASWSTPASGTAAFEPFCALRVPAGFEDIQVFDADLDSEGQLGDWLRGLAAQSSAKADDWEAMADSATRALTLVTCSEAWFGSPERTLLVFAAS